MKYKNIDNIKKIAIIALSSLLLLILILSVPVKNTVLNTAYSHTSSKNVLEVIKKIKEDNKSLELIYESDDKSTFKSLVFKNANEEQKDINEVYKSIIIDTKTGEEIPFLDLIKKDKINLFETKEKELLELKYPEFITKAINENKSSTGYKIYYVKNNEVIIYYYDYIYDEIVTENISLKINYNEIKDYLNFNPVLDKHYENENGYNYSKDKKTVSITFDDGPSSKYNPLILDSLLKNKAHATFFMVGTMMNSCHKCVVATYKSGNEVASHTYEHMNIKRNKPESVKESLDKVNDIYNKLTGDNIKYLRPPYGAYNKLNLDNASVPFVLWNLDTEDWRYKDVDHIVNYIIDNVSDGSIILMHELYQTSYEALKIVLPKLYAMGYQVVSVGELASLKGRTLEAGHAYRKIL